MSDLPESDELDRRSVLRNLGAVGALGTGIGASSGVARAGSGTELAAAKADVGIEGSAREYVEAEFGDRDSVLAEFERGGWSVVDALSEKGFLDDLSTDELGPVLPFPAFQEDDRHGVMTVSPLPVEDTVATDIQMQLQTADHTVRVHLQPELDRQFAIVDPEGDDLLVDPKTGTVSEPAAGARAAGDDDVSTTADCAHCYGEDNIYGGCDYKKSYHCDYSERCECYLTSTWYRSYERECRCCCAMDDDWVCYVDGWTCNCDTNEWCI